MKTKKVKITVILVLLALLVSLTVLLNYSYGNPISKTLAANDIKKYIAKTYVDSDYTVEDISYAFIEKNYSATIVSPSSADSIFHVNWCNGSIIYDDYSTYITERSNTIHRYEEEARKQIQSLLSDVSELNGGNINVNYADKLYYSETARSLVLDSPYDKSLPLPLTVSITTTSSSPTLAEYASLLEQIHGILASNGYPINTYSVENSNGTYNLFADKVTPKHIESGSLLYLLREAQSKETDCDTNDYQLTVKVN